MTFLTLRGLPPPDCTTVNERPQRHRHTHIPGGCGSGIATYLWSSQVTLDPVGLNCEETQSCILTDTQNKTVVQAGREQVGLEAFVTAAALDHVRLQLDAAD